MLNTQFRRQFLKNIIATAALGLGLSSSAFAQKPAEPLRIGFQKSASLLTLLKSQGALEKRLAPLGVEVKWIEFPAGPQLLEGLNVGSIDFGYVGEAPPIFAQAAGANFIYIGYEAPAPAAEAIVVPKDSPIKSVAELKGKKIALNKGSNVHYLLVKLLEKAGLKYSDVQPVFLPPADARAAFERGSVDAWVIWDPFLAAAEKQIEAKVLADGKGVVNNHAFFLAAKQYAERRQDVITLLFDVLSKQGQTITKDYKGAAQALSPLQGLDPAVIELSLRRYSHDVRPLNAAVLAEQQKIADVFSDLQLIPKKINVREAAPLLK
ncbi:sulfonate ABC transporter substrate-binding protein [Parvibium lacunae]|uniref:Putative aliphatic sulfonates-binding protein n=1 Tax=Parvibium lacunae TaxID=1888893 RepID=A0A368L3I5_9BURK|nr:sulfonate ABC transporter substrate-binding protein [Parvibium lacunae]RCS58156.1 sulfonate ABC transporter substrate-binding protein [Parvibium lacunae]